MGIFCEINLHKPADGAFVPGSTVSGTIKYAFDEETSITQLTTSLKGKGYVILRRKHKQNSNSFSVLRSHEEYLNIENVIMNEDKGSTFPTGSYETPFSFQLPEGIPPSYKYIGMSPRYRIRCYINYYINIKFERPGLFNFTKKYKKEITVTSKITPTLNTTPVIHGERKELFQLFSKKESVVNIKATIQNSVIKPGDKIDCNYEVSNDSNVVIKGIETKLVEVNKFVARNRNTVSEEDIINTDSKTGSLQSGETRSLPVDIIVPSDKSSIDNARIVTRDYVVRVIVELPFPHRNAVLDIPVQIGYVDLLPDANDEPPPSYWEAMGEVKGDGDDDEKDGEDSS